MRVILIAAALAACASAGTPTNLGPADAAVDGSHKTDAENGVPIDGPHHDAAVPHDAPPDAFVPHNADADTTGAFCNGNADCTTTGECCVSLGGPGICAPGTVIGSSCLPQ